MENKQHTFIARVRGRNLPDKLRDITIESKVRNEMQLEVGDYLKVTVERVDLK